MDTITIEVDADIHAYLRSRVKDFRETESDVLRRELGLAGADDESIEDDALAGILRDPRLRSQSTAQDRYRFLLGELYRIKGLEFEKLLPIEGSKRRYFAKSRAEILAASKTARPSPIPGSPYWAAINASNSQKADILRRVLLALGYSSAVAEAFARVIDD